VHSPTLNPTPRHWAAGNTRDPESPATHFRGWLVGQLAKWAEDDPAKQAVANSHPLLSTTALGVKFRLEERGKTGPAEPDVLSDGKVTLGILISGHMRIQLTRRRGEGTITRELTPARRLCGVAERCVRSSLGSRRALRTDYGEVAGAEGRGRLTVGPCTRLCTNTHTQTARRPGRDLRADYVPSSETTDAGLTRAPVARLAKQALPAELPPRRYYEPAS
jgi:hypothetical protein